MSLLRAFYIHLSQVHVDLHRLQINMTEDALQFKDIATVAQKLNREGIGGNDAGGH